MLCPSCGHQIRSDARFCDTCGARLSRGSQAGNMPAPQPQFGTQDTGPGGMGWQSPTTVNQPLPTSVPQRSATSRPPTTPVKPGRQGDIMGMARNIQQRSEQSVYGRYPVQILSFRLEQYDRSGNRTQLVPVEMRGRSISGFVSDGDQVEVLGKLDKGLFQSKRVYNRTTGTTVKVKGRTLQGATFIVMGVLLVLIVVGFFLLYTRQASFGIPILESYNSPDYVLTSYCNDLKSGAYQSAYDQYSTGLKNKGNQLAQMWSGKSIESCTNDSVQVSGTRATTTLSITALILSNQATLPEQTSTYHVILVQDGSNGWKIDSIQP